MKKKGKDTVSQTEKVYKRQTQREQTELRRGGFVAMHLLS